MWDDVKLTPMHKVHRVDLDEEKFYLFNKRVASDRIFIPERGGGSSFSGPLTPPLGKFAFAPPPLALLISRGPKQHLIIN